MSHAAYGWIIDTDHWPDTDSPEGTNANAKGVMGPHDISHVNLKALLAGEGRTFRMLDADGEKMYTGRIVTPAGEEEGVMDFAPLEDFGKPNAGATEIHYQRDNGAWYEL